MSGKIDKYEHIKGEEVLPSDQRKVIQQATFILGKALEKQTITIENQCKKNKEKQLNNMKSNWLNSVNLDFNNQEF